MGLYQETSIYICGLIVCAAFTVISPFYPKAAQSKGVPFWVTGVVFSLVPIFGLLSSLVLGSFLYKLGRRTCFTAGIVLVGISNILISLIVFGDTATVIFFSFLSRILAGIGTAFSMTSGYAILTSENAENVQKTVAKMEAFCGLGLIAGPLIGSGLFAAGGIFYSFLLVGVILVAYAPLGWFLLGKTKPYIISEDKINIIQILIKPKILLDAFCQASIMFTLGFIAPSLELHILNFDIEEEFVGVIYSVNTFTYAISCYLLSYIPQNYNKRAMMAMGLFFVSLAFLLMGPCPFLLPSDFWIVVTSLFFLGVGGAMIYVPSLPNMIDNAHIRYGYGKDDRLNDALAGITTFSLNFGEMCGPGTAGFMLSYLNFPESATLISIIIMTYFVIYLIGSDLLIKVTKPYSSKVAGEQALIELKTQDDN